jgi:hypothetical protein
MIGSCDVCRTRGDNSIKEVRWCGLCQKWLCDGCRWSWARVQAALGQWAGNP